MVLFEKFGKKITNVLLVLVVVMFVSFSGCTSSGGGGGSSSGLEITLFEITPTQIYEDESVEVSIILENRGDKTMFTDSKLWVYGPSQNEWEGTGEMDDAFSLSGLDIHSEDMVPGDYTEITGGFTYIGDVQQGTYKEYDFIARLCYPYETTYVGNFYAVSRDEARLEKKTGNLYDVLSSGPIGISFEKRDRIVTGNAVRGSVNIEGRTKIDGVTIRIHGSYKSGEGETVRYVSLPIEITNRGSGFPTLPTDCALGPDVKSEDMGYVAVRVLLNGEDITASCFRGEDTKEVEVTYRDGTTRVGLFGIVKLRREGNTYKTGRISCRLEGLDFDTPKKQYNLEIRAFYDYYVDQKQHVVVKSTEDIY